MRGVREIFLVVALLMFCKVLCAGEGGPLPRGEEEYRRIRQLKYERAVTSGDLRDWVTFYDKYTYREWATDDDKMVLERMREKAKNEIERLLYERIIVEPTLELCEDYLKRYPEGPHIQNVTIKMEPLLFDSVIKKNTAKDYLKYLQTYPDGYREKEVRDKFETLLFKNLANYKDLLIFEQYLQVYSKDREALLTKMEPYIFAWAKKVNTINSYKKYEDLYPKTHRYAEVHSLLDSLVFQKASGEDFYTDYQSYLKEFPAGAYVEKAKQRIGWLKSQKAVVTVEFPRELEATNKPPINVLPPYWGFHTVFKETGGKIGFRVKGVGYVRGPYHIAIIQPEVRVAAGGSGKDFFWCSSGSHALCNNSDVLITYSGEDAEGNKISISVSVHLKHTGCRGYRESK